MDHNLVRCCTSMQSSNHSVILHSWKCFVFMVKVKNICILRGRPWLAHPLLDLTEDLLLQFGGVILLQHVVLPPRLSPLLGGVLHLLWGQAQVEADSLDVELGSLPTFGPRPWAHPYSHLLNGQRCSFIFNLNMFSFFFITFPLLVFILKNLLIFCVIVSSCTHCHGLGFW